MKIIKSLLLMLVVAPSCLAASLEQEAVLKQLKLPAGFNISIFADNIPNARQMALGDDGVVYVGSRQGHVYAVQDKDGDGIAEQRYLIAQQLNLPNGVAYKDGSLYVAEIQRIIRFDNIGTRLTNPPQPTTVFDQLPSDRHHGWKYLRFGPDGKLYTAVGAPCNVCDPDKPIYGSLIRMNADGSNMEILARGIRNTVGFDWETRSGHLFFNDNGRDYLGDDTPPDELNEWNQVGQHFGFPYCHAGSIADPDHAGDKKCYKFTAPIWKYKAHIAPLGMRFYTGKQFPDTYFRQLFVAQHGSWNRSEPQGYQVNVVKIREGQPYNEQTFISGWLTAQGTVLGRPNDIVQMRDGSLLISDDSLGVIYRVSYGK
ncbi:PQQ-dependent sugar dehydrogenase [Methylomonas montana]|uniref:PQQ-dependent sugar dehydrogenase n=1 Tax=Methylomonas montana TaxID=3058963 RepID=UPI0026596D30|nr:PQQ-dependent sugar dehydrogenase [Methylomonas montana]WKJ89617.1 PQQ-dependent sugar dehydrogenase [Methylomonas montana]